MAKRFDELDLRILERLQEHGRRPFAEIGRDLEISEGTVRARIARLERLGAVKFVAEVDPIRMGLALAHVGVQVRASGVRQVADALAAIPEVNFVTICLGSFDLVIEIVCADDDDLFRLVEVVRLMEGVDRVEAFTVLEVTKDIYTYRAWGSLLGKAVEADGG